MPEGDTIYRVAMRLSEALAGTTITRFEARVESLATTSLVGEIIDEVEPAGKHLLIHIGDWTLHSHMRMSGTWQIYPNGSRWRRPGFQARIVLANEEVEAVGFLISDIKLVERKYAGKLVTHLGPDPLKPEWNKGGSKSAAANLAKESRPIHVAILDQSNVAGFGNVYANEMCFLMGVDPATPASSVDTDALVTLGARLIRANRDRTERTTTGNTRAGRRLHIYGRAGQPCGRCGTTVRFTRLGANYEQMRHVYWCPHCQPLRV